MGCFQAKADAAEGLRIKEIGDHAAALQAEVEAQEAALMAPSEALNLQLVVTDAYLGVHLDDRTCSAQLDWTVSQLKTKFVLSEAQAGIVAADVTMSFGNETLKDDATLKALDIQQDATVSVQV